MIIDTHCHLHFKDFDADREAVLDRALKAGVERMVIVGTDPDTNAQAARLADQHTQMVCSAGLHPHSAHEFSKEQIDAIGQSLSDKVVAIGEIGLDYFKSEAPPEIQKKVFAQMIQLALSKNLPVIVHSRNAFDDTFAMIKSEGQGRLRGVMHCYSYGKDELSKVLDQGFVASFACNITYKSAAALLDVAVTAPLDRIVIETDAPYLSPQNLRGQRNESANLRGLVEFLSAKRGITPQEFEETTTQNAKRLFVL